MNQHSSTRPLALVSPHTRELAQDAQELRSKHQEGNESTGIERTRKKIQEKV